MYNKTSTYIIVAFSIFVGLLHFIIGPDYQGIFRDFIRGYLIDILLPMNLYLLMQIALRKHISVNKARITGAIVPFAFGTKVQTINSFNSQYGLFRHLSVILFILPHLYPMNVR